MSKKSCFIAERLFYWHREPFTALQEAAVLKGGKEEPSEVSEEKCPGPRETGGKGVTVPPRWPRSEPWGLRRSCVKPGQDGVPGRTELFWVRTGQI